MTTYTFPIEKGHVISFARSLGEENPIYFDEVYAADTELGTTIAPPTFTQAALRFAPSNPFRPGRDRDGGDAAQGSKETSALSSSGGTQLHAEQHFEYFRPVRVGETLSVVERVGSTWQKQGRRGGLLDFTETVSDFLDVDGEIVITARSVAVQTSRVVDEG